RLWPAGLPATAGEAAAGIAVAVRTATSAYFGTDRTGLIKEEEEEVQPMPVPTAIVQFPTDHHVHVTSSAADNAYGSSRTIQSYRSWAEYIFRDLGLIVPERDHLFSTVRLALRAQELYFAAALHQPDKHH